MQILQTGDLHLGKMFYERSLIEDQVHMLSQLIEELSKEKENSNPYDALFITGDIYDRAVPSPEAVCVFDNFLTEVRQKFPELHIFIISGNHDSPARISYAAQILKKQNIHITTTAEQITQPVLINQVAVYSIPFLFPGFLGKDFSNQQEMAQEVVNRILEHHQKNYPDYALVANAHLFTSQGNPSESERIFIGTAEQVDAKIFEKFDYTAIGHLHRCQNPKENVWYSGSPLAYSFAEVDGTDSEKCFLKVILNPQAEKSLSVEKIPVKPLHPVIRLSGSFEDFYRDTEGKYNQYKNCFIEISCTDLFLVENPMTQLKVFFPYLLSFRQDNAIQTYSTESLSKRRELLTGSNKDSQTEANIFTTFIQETCGSLPENFDKELELFLKIAREQEVEF